MGPIWLGRMKLAHAGIEIDGAVIELGYVVLALHLPLSKNGEPKSHWSQGHRFKRYWSVFAYQAWLIAGRPRFERAEIQPVYFFVDSRARDMDNYTGLAMKGILDGLKGNLLADDR